MIVLPKFELKTITLEHMCVLQESLQRKKRHEILRKEHKQRQVLLDIRDMSADVFDILDSIFNKPIIEKRVEKLVHIVDKIRMRT